MGWRAKSFQFKCGHYVCIHLQPYHSEQWAAERLCPDCYKDQKNAERAEQASALGFPSLNGSPKQIAWAESIRLEKISAVRERFDSILKQHPESSEKEKAEFEAKKSEAIEWMKNQISAKFWIDNRFADDREFCRMIIG
jgi:hypothetical protein